MRRAGNRGWFGFTVIELIVMVAIIGILTLVAIPSYLSTTANAKLRDCQNNMHAIGDAIKAAKVAGKNTDFSSFTGAPSLTKEPLLGQVPVCPIAGDTYTITTTGTGAAQTFTVTCSNPAHGSYTPTNSPQYTK